MVPEEENGTEAEFEVITAENVLKPDEWYIPTHKKPKDSQTE